MSNKKCICFVYTETTGLHKDMKEDVSKKKLFLYARLVVLNYEIGYIENGEYVQEKQVRSIVKPRSMVITEDSVQFHGITNDHALKEGIEPVPLEAIPMDGLLFVHGKLVAFPIILTVLVGALLQNT